MITRAEAPFGASTDPMPIKTRTAQTWEFCMHDP